jgi:hypothetical protein
VHGHCVRRRRDGHSAGEPAIQGAEESVSSDAPMCSKPTTAPFGELTETTTCALLCCAQRQNTLNTKLCFGFNISIRSFVRSELGCAAVIHACAHGHHQRLAHSEVG